MAATAQSDLYSQLVRKLGYSVGLEFLMPRVEQLVERFILKGRIDASDWRDLVQVVWDRNASAEQHIADVYGQLDLVQRQNNAVYPLPALETLGILMLEPSPVGADSISLSNSKAALKFILTTKVIEADGDIFLNALATAFDPPRLRKRLQTMIRYKRQKVSPQFKQAAMIRRMAEAISIRNQVQGSGGNGAGKLSYAQKSRLLRASTESAASVNVVTWVDQELIISDDYVEKVCTTRRKWAEDLGLVNKHDSGVTSIGVSLMEGCKDLGLFTDVGGDEAFAFWPYGYQLRGMSLAPDVLGVKDLTRWEMLSLLARVIAVDAADKTNRGQVNEMSRGQVISLLNLIHKRYQGISGRGMIRHDLPLFIAEPVLAFWLSTSKPPQHLDFRNFLSEELKRSDRLLDVVNIRGTEGGLRLMSGGTRQ